MGTFAVTAVGPDGTGKVAALAAALADAGANLEDVTMTRLGGQFAMVLLTSAPGSAASLAAALAHAGTGLDVAVRPLERTDAPRAAAPYRVVVHGADRVGIVARVASCLADGGANITDLSCRLSGALYVMTLEVDVPGEADPLRAALADAAAELDVVVRLDPAEEDVL